MRQHLNGTFQKKSLFVKKRNGAFYFTFIQRCISPIIYENSFIRFIRGGGVGKETMKLLIFNLGFKGFFSFQNKVPHTKKEIQCKPLFLYHESPFKHQSNQFLRACVVYSKTQRRYLSLYSLQHLNGLLLKYDMFKFYIFFYSYVLRKRLLSVGKKQKQRRIDEIQCGFELFVYFK